MLKPESESFFLVIFAFYHLVLVTHILGDGKALLCDNPPVLPSGGH